MHVDNSFSHYFSSSNFTSILDSQRTALFDGIKIVFLLLIETTFDSESVIGTRIFDHKTSSSILDYNVTI